MAAGNSTSFGEDNDKLMCWGAKVKMAKTLKITFPTHFKSTPLVTVSYETRNRGSGASNDDERLAVIEVNEREFTVHSGNFDSRNDLYVNWIAVGDKP
jgi:hypothetical protein